MFDNVDRLKFQRRWSALHFAVFGNHADVIQLLFELGANVCFDVIYVCRCLIYRVIRSMFSVHATGLRCIRLHFSVMPRAFRHCSLPVPIRSVSTLADICHTSLQSSKRYMIMSAGICPKSHTLKLQHTACYKLLKNATKATPVREKSPRKLLGSVTVAHGLGAAPSASESTRLAVPDAANSARAKPRVAQSSPNLMRHAERTWTCPSCEYAHNAAAICAVCATNRPGTSAACRRRALLCRCRRRRRRQLPLRHHRRATDRHDRGDWIVRFKRCSRASSSRHTPTRLSRTKSIMPRCCCSPRTISRISVSRRLALDASYWPTFKTQSFSHTNLATERRTRCKLRRHCPAPWWHRSCRATSYFARRVAACTSERRHQRASMLM
jgi:hypothetical protein